MKSKYWYDYLWIWSIVYFSLGFFNILFAWLGMIDFFVPIIIAVFAGNKWFCNRLCGRGQLFSKLGGALKFFWKQTGSPMAGVEMVQIWFSCIFPCHVFKHDIPDLFGCIKSKNTK